MRKEIRSLQQRLKMTMVYVTHDQVEAMTIADRILLIKNGIIEQHGTPEELYNCPATAFTGSFIGNPPMNILTPDALIIDALPSLPLPPIGSTAPYLLGVRPEDIEISGNSGMECSVEVTEYLGADTLIACRAGRHSITLIVKGRTDVSAGDLLKLSWKPEHIHLFNAANGKRLVDFVKGVTP